MIFKSFISLFFVLITICGVVAQDYYAKDPNVDIKHYTFNLTLSDNTDEIIGSAGITVEFKDLIKPFKLDLVNFNSESKKGMTVDSVLENNRKISFSHKNNKLEIEPNPGGLDLRTIQIYYRGTPADGLIIDKNKFGERTFFGDNWPDRARNWIPCVDHPSDKATVEFIVTAPDKYDVIANGRLLELSHIENGQRITQWKEDIEISTKVMVIGVARFSRFVYEIYNGVPIEAWVFPQNRTEGYNDYHYAVEIIKYFDNNIGQYSYEKLANVQSKTRYGGMENASNIFYFENSVNGKENKESLIAHEIAHQWFGNSATEDSWSHLWLSEGFATYFTHMYFDNKYGIDTLRNRMTKDRKSIVSYFQNNPDRSIVDATRSNVTELLNTNTYQKGSWFLHMLHYKLGNEAFWRGIKQYYRTYRNSNASSNDFKLIMEQVSNKNLAKFFDQWLNTPGHPELKYDWKYSKKNKEITIDIQQVQKTPFTFELEIAFVFKDGGSQVETVTINSSEETYALSLNKKPEKIIIDPFVKLLYEQIN